MKSSVSKPSLLNLSVLKATSVISAILFATTACAQSPQSRNVGQNQHVQSSSVTAKVNANQVSASIDSQLR